MAKKDIAVKNNQLPEWLASKINDARGSEEVSASDLTIPRIELCQALSKCRKKSDPNYIDGIEEGQMYNSVSRVIYGGEVSVIPVYFRKEFLLWRDQSLGGGFGGSYASYSDAQQALNSIENPEQWEIVDTAQQFVLVVLKDGGVEEAVLSMAKSKARVSRDWNSLIRMAGGPRFSRVYTVAGVAAQNSKNQDFHTYKVAMAGFVTEEQFKYAESVYNMIKSGSAGVDYSDADSISDSEM